jgi:cysteine synthase A
MKCERGAPTNLIPYHSPMLYLDKITKGTACKGRIIAKMESLGPCSSVKDRLGKSMIDEAEKSGKLKPGMTLVEPTSGNTGISLASLARERGYGCILTMPETMSMERRMMLLALGAEVVLTPKETAVSGALAKAHEILTQMGPDKAIMLNQFENPSNSKIHRETTGPEIVRDTDGLFDVFVSGVGTGGTITGVSQFLKGCPPSGCADCDCKELKGAKKDVHIVAVEPMEQMLLTAARGGEKLGPQGPHKIQGMGAGIIPKVLDLDLVDEIVSSGVQTLAECFCKDL